MVWWAVVEDSPDQDRSITDAELEYLRNTIGVTTKEVGSESLLRGVGYVQINLYINSGKMYFGLFLLILIFIHSYIEYFNVCRLTIK